MKILAISPRIPEEGAKGDQVLSFHRLSYLARTNQIKLICFGSMKTDLVAKRKLEALGIVVQVIHWSRWLALLGVIRAIFNSNMPFQCAWFQSSAFQYAVRSSMHEFTPDLIYAITIRGLGNLENYCPPLFVDMVDSMALNFSRRVEMAYGFKRWLLNNEYHRVSDYEKRVAQRAVRSFVVSSIDQQKIGSERVSVIPLGIDVNSFFKFSKEPKEPVIVFTGNMGYQPNVDAVQWFHKHCWSLLKESVPQLGFIIAGRNPTKELVALGSDVTITVSGSVPSVCSVINTASIAIAPMQSGSGMQFKILEAMACGVPVVANTLGLGDIRAIPGRDLLVSDRPDEFIRSVISLIESVDLRQSIGNAGLKYVNTHHTWDALNLYFEKSLVDEILKLSEAKAG